MSDDAVTLDAIRARWSDAGPWRVAESVDDDVPIVEIVDADGATLLYELGPDESERALLQLAAAAPADVRALLAAVAQAEAEAAAYRMLQVDLWKLIGRCDMAFELITEAKLLGPAKKTARQLRAEIRKASGA